MSKNNIVELLGSEASYLLEHKSETIPAASLHLPNPNHIDEVWAQSNRNIPTLRSLQSILGHGRLGNTGYVSILPVDQGIEHSGAASFAPNPAFFDPEKDRKSTRLNSSHVAISYAVFCFKTKI